MSQRRSVGDSLTEEIIWGRRGGCVVEVDRGWLSGEKGNNFLSESGKSGHP